MINTNELTIFVNSCDLYADAWPLFFTLFKQNGGKILHYPIVLATEKKHYCFEDMKIHTISSGFQSTWSKRMVTSCQQIESEYFLFTLEDYFLLSKFNYEEFNKIFSFMKADKNIGYVGFSRRTDVKQNCGQWSVLDLTKQRMNLTVSIWKKDFFIKLLRKHESIWDFERYSHIRALQYNYIALTGNLSTPEIYRYMQPSSVENGKNAVGGGYGIIRGKWFKETQKLTEEYGVKVNFANLGFYEPQTQDGKKDVTLTKQYPLIIQKIINRYRKYKHRLVKWLEKRRLEKSYH